MTRLLSRRVVAVAVACFVLAGPMAWAQGGPLKVGEVRPFVAETPHPYPLGTEARPVVWRDRVFSPGAEWVRVHFSGLDLAKGDFLTVSDRDGKQTWTYKGKGPHGNGDVWSFSVDGDTAMVELHGGRGNGHGYKIDMVGHGTLALHPRRPVPSPEVVCGTDGREDVACHSSNSTFDTAENSVARLLFQQGAFFYVCTGWLTAGSNANTLVTNNHCISSQNVTNTLEATFGYQRTGCGTGSINNGTPYAGGTFLKTHNKLDYSLLTLQGNPEATWGKLTPKSSQAPVGTVIWFIQHPGGNEKKVGWFEESSHTAVCDVELVDQTYSGTTRKSQMAYSCDSEGGSSGSPIVQSGTNKVVGLHHFGGVSSNPCRNSATEMPEICSNAGALLSCVTN
jgi:lysyl endopeptidase